MRYAMIMAGGSGTRLWPMSRSEQPKQLIPFLPGGKSLLHAAWDRLDGLVPASNRLICAGADLRPKVLDALPGIEEAQYFAEPAQRDTLNAVGYVAAVIAESDPDAVIGVFTADHLIEPVDHFQATVKKGYELAEAQPNTLVTFGITPDEAATGYGYLQLGESINDDARKVDQFKEKPDAPTAQQYLDAGPEHYLWNSGMFVWRAATLVKAIEKFVPDNAKGLNQIARAWDSPNQQGTLERVYAELPKISVDFAVMEPASTDPDFAVAAVPMELNWLDVGSWPAFAKTCQSDDSGNAAGDCKHLFHDSRNTLAASSDPDHLIATIGCDDLIIIHTPDATLVCPADRAQDIKAMHKAVQEKFGADRV